MKPTSRHAFLPALALLCALALLHACGSEGMDAAADAKTVDAAPRESASTTAEPGLVPGIVFRRTMPESSRGMPALEDVDELVIIERESLRADLEESDPAPAARPRPPARYGLLRCDEGSDEKVPLPLEHTDVKGAIRGVVSSVEVVQRFGNPFDTTIEAEYVFPLPQDAAVTDFVMIVGERRIWGIIREREEAERIYHAARSRGHVASLLTQERPNVFTQRVANIEPGKRIDVSLTFFNALQYSDGWYRFTMPMVVGPRFNPPGSTEGVGTAPHGASGTSGQASEVSYLKPGQDSGHRLSLSVDVDAGASLEGITCRTHAVQIAHRGEGLATVTLADEKVIPDRDFVLHFRVAGDAVKSSLLTQRDERGGFFTLVLHPPRALQGLRRQPVELVFVVDCSGSMRGRPMQQARAAMLASIGMMREDDTFQIIRFSDEASSFGRHPLPATRRNRERARRYLERLEANGGTMMERGLRAALDVPHDPERLRFVVFVTDGYIGNERDVLAALKRGLGEARVFSFGVGSSPNHYLMQRMAKLGRGSAAFLGLEDNAEEVMGHFFRRVSHPALRDIEIDWNGLQPRGLMPRRIPDLFVGRPVVVCGRFDGEAPERLQLRARAGARDVAHEISVRGGQGEPKSALPILWARARIAELMDQTVDTPDRHGELAQEIKDTALDFGLISAYTAFVAVDSMTRTSDDSGVTVPVSVPVPHGVRYDTTVEDR